VAILKAKGNSKASPIKIITPLRNNKGSNISPDKKVATPGLRVAHTRNMTK